MEPYSLDLRQRVVEAYEQGKGFIAQIADMFSVGQTFVKKMLRQKRLTGSLDPLPHGGGKKPSLKPEHISFLRAKVRQQSDLSLQELQSLLQEEASISVHSSTISRALNRIGLTRKKKSSIP